MENEIIFKQFEELEQKVDYLIKTRESYESSNAELKNKIQRLEEELIGKAEAENNYIREKELILSKIDHLLGKLADTIAS